MQSKPTLHDVFHYHEALNPRIHAYLNNRGISDRMIDCFLLGWNGKHITIPIFDREERLAYVKLAKDPDDHESPKMLIPEGARAELFGWEHLKNEVFQVVICEGEFDRLVLEDHDIAAVTSTGGAGVFRPEWAEALNGTRELYLCFDRDEAGRRGAERLARLLPHAKVIELPNEVGEGGDITDYFVRLKHTTGDFLSLLSAAKPFPKANASPLRNDIRSHFHGDEEIARLKTAVRIESLISRYCKLRQSGSTYIGQCPFHEDGTPSFVVYPTTQTFHCFGCEAHGDVFTFLMRKEGVSFPEALKVVRSLATHG